MEASAENEEDQLRPRHRRAQGPRALSSTGSRGRWSNNMVIVRVDPGLHSRDLDHRGRRLSAPTCGGQEAPRWLLGFSHPDGRPGAGRHHGDRGRRDTKIKIDRDRTRARRWASSHPTSAQHPAARTLQGQGRQATPTNASAARSARPDRRSRRSPDRARDRERERAMKDEMIEEDAECKAPDVGRRGESPRRAEGSREQRSRASSPSTAPPNTCTHSSSIRRRRPIRSASVIDAVEGRDREATRSAPATSRRRSVSERRLRSIAREKKIEEGRLQPKRLPLPRACEGRRRRRAREAGLQF